MKNNVWYGVIAVLFITLVSIVSIQIYKSTNPCNIGEVDSLRDENIRLQYQLSIIQMQTEAIEAKRDSDEAALKRKIKDLENIPPRYEKIYQDYLHLDANDRLLFFSKWTGE